MTKPSFITRLNWRLILLHFAACWCFAYAFNMFYYLHDLEFVRAIENYYAGDKKQFPTELGNGRVYFFVYWMSLSLVIGEFVAFITSLLISFKKHWFWLNSLTAFFISFLLIRFDIDGWRWLKHVFLKPGRLFGYPSAGYFILNGGVLLFLGSLCLFLPAAMKFVDDGYSTRSDEHLEAARE